MLNFTIAPITAGAHAKDAFVMIVDRDRQDFFGAILADYILVKMLNNGARAGDGARLARHRFARLYGFAQSLFGQNFGPQQHTLIADKDITRPFDEAVNF